MTTAVVPSELLAEIQNFYARQVQDMDNGRFAEFADTFMHECEFTPMKHKPTAHGRQAIVDKLDDFAKQTFGSDEQRRHWIAMTVVDEVDVDTYDVVSYALVTRTKAGEPPVLHFAGEIVDRLVRDGGAIKVLRRMVNSDSIA
ncbi:MAG TPA: nuclear transport factor 2 family protein [Pseudonocardiaceae bacterium]|jgi:actinorhodin biosynthesis protein ActVIA